MRSIEEENKRGETPSSMLPLQTIWSLAVEGHHGFCNREVVANVRSEEEQDRRDYLMFPVSWTFVCAPPSPEMNSPAILRPQPFHVNLHALQFVEQVLLKIPFSRLNEG